MGKEALTNKVTGYMSFVEFPYKLPQTEMT